MRFLRQNIHLFLLLGIIGVGALIRLKDIGGPSLWYDELDTVRISLSPLSEVFPQALGERDPPFYHFALHFWGELGSGDAWVRLVSAAAGIAVIGLVYAIGRDLFSRRVGLLGAAFAALSPLLVWYSRDATDYSMAVASTSASLFFLIRAARGDGWKNWILYGVASAAALFTHYYNILFLAAEIPLFLLIKKDEGKVRPWLLSEAALGLLIGPWMLMLHKTNSYGPGTPSINLPDVRGLMEAMGTAPFSFIKGYAGLMGRGETSLSLSMLISGRQAIILVLISLAFCFLASFGRRFTTTTYRRNLLALSFFSILTISLPAVLTLAQGGLITGRYYAAAAPVFLLLLAALIDVLPTRVAWLPAGLIIILMLFFLNVQRHGYSYEDWRGIMKTISANTGSGDEILCFPDYQCSAAKDYYFSTGTLDLPIKGGVVTSDNQKSVYGFRPDFKPIIDEVELKKRLTETLASEEGLWFISGTGNLGNYPKATEIEKALSSEWNLQQDWDFTPLSLKLYKKK